MPRTKVEEFDPRDCQHENDITGACRQVLLPEDVTVFSAISPEFGPRIIVLAHMIIDGYIPPGLTVDISSPLPVCVRSKNKPTCVGYVPVEVKV